MPDARYFAGAVPSMEKVRIDVELVLPLRHEPSVGLLLGSIHVCVATYRSVYRTAYTVSAPGQHAHRVGPRRGSW